MSARARGNSVSFTSWSGSVAVTTIRPLVARGLRKKPLAGVVMKKTCSRVFRP
jgi:hypothetical protein